MLHKRKNNKWRSALWALLSLILIGAVPVSASSENAQNSEKGTVVFTERAIGGGPYRINVMLTKTISEEEPPFIVLTEENGYSGSLNVTAGQYNVRATIVERDAPDDAAASAVNATVYVTAGLQQSVTVYVGTVEDLKNAGAYFGEGDTGYGKTVKEPESAGWEGEEIPDPATGQWNGIRMWISRNSRRRKKVSSRMCGASAIWESRSSWSYLPFLACRDSREETGEGTRKNRPSGKTDCTRIMPRGMQHGKCVLPGLLNMEANDGLWREKR